jgi:hypothetical protein
MKKIIVCICIIFLLSTCKKDDEIYTTKNVNVTVPAIIDTTFSFTPFPNPCDSFVNLSIKFPRASTVSISIYDMVGRLVYQPNVSLQLAAGCSSIGIDVSVLQPGVYIVICKYDVATMAKKIIVE